MDNQNFQNPAPNQNGYNPVPNQGAYNPVPTQGAYNPAPNQEAYNPAPTQGAYNPVPNQGAYNPVPNQGTYTPAPNQGGFPQNPTKKNNKLIIGLGAGAGAVVIIVVCLFLFLKGNSPTGVVKDYLNASFKPDFKKASSCNLLYSGEEYYESLAEAQDKTVEELYEQLSNGKADNYNDFCDVNNESEAESLENKYGENIKVEFKEITEEKLSDSKLNAFKKLFDKSDKEFDIIDFDNVKEAYKVKVKYKVNGSEKSETFTKAFLVLKYKGSYKIATDNYDYIDSMLSIASAYADYY